ncbi:MAG: phosphoglucosamine mutase [Gammaproteobacteria bacterium]|nr:phosphoglucosamine mutase [Gammaproteobacteria bacterium]
MSKRKSSQKKYFGTDGIRGRVGESPITPEFCLRLGWAVGKVFASKGECHILIGKDTRISGYMLESVLESGLASAGANVSLLTVMPTPAIAYLTRTLRADAGIVISASHNPYFDNGIKFFDANGNKLGDEIELEIEAQLQADMACVDSDRLGKADRIEDAPGRYIEFCKATVGRSFRFEGMKIVLDCANGATYHVAPRVFEELGADIVVVGAEPDGTNINAGCGSTSPELLAGHVRTHGADVGVAFDGDGDRVIMVDARGEVVDGDELLYIIARHRAAADSLQGGVVGTVMSNFGLERALGELNIPFERAAVGDRYVLEALRGRGWTVGGEASGHILCLDLTTTGDAIVAALQALTPMVEQQASLHELKQGMSKLPQVMLNVAAPEPSVLAGSAAVQAAVTDKMRLLEGRGRVLVRPSGTEPVIRVMVEGDDRAEVSGIAEELAAAVQQNA